jgi:hypothetical protein
MITAKEGAMKQVATDATSTIVGSSARLSVGAQWSGCRQKGGFCKYRPSRARTFLKVWNLE